MPHNLINEKEETECIITRSLQVFLGVTCIMCRRYNDANAIIHIVYTRPAHRCMHECANGAISIMRNKHAE